VDGLGNAYINETGSNRIRKMTPGLAVTTLAPSFSFSSQSRLLPTPGNVYVANQASTRS